MFRFDVYFSVFVLESTKRTFIILMQRELKAKAISFGSTKLREKCLLILPSNGWLYYFTKDVPFEDIRTTPPPDLLKSI